MVVTSLCEVPRAPTVCTGMNKPDQGDGRFPATQWSLVARVGADDEGRRREALESLLARYLPAMRAHLVYRKGMRPENADDLLQEFVVGKILEKDLILQADRELGKFRTFLLTALDRFLINQLRDQRAAKRSPGAPQMSLDEGGDHAASAQNPSDAFDVAWARQVVDEALGRMQGMCEGSGRPDIWELFQLRIARPILEGAEPVGYAQLIRQFGFRSPSQASNALVTAKRMYARALREVVSEYVRDEGEISAEVAELQQVLARGSMP